MAYTIGELRFRHPDYNPDRAQKLISSSMSRHLSTLNISKFSSKSMHAFLSNLTNRQTDAAKRIYSVRGSPGSVLSFAVVDKTQHRYFL